MVKHITYTELASIYGGRGACTCYIKNMDMNPLGGISPRTNTGFNRCQAVDLDFQGDCEERCCYGKNAAPYYFWNQYDEGPIRNLGDKHYDCPPLYILSTGLTIFI